MLSIGTVTAGNAAQRAYHERQLAQSRDDYYREAEGPAGAWVGTAAAGLGLQGEVTVEQFGRMLDGQHPGTGEALGGRMDRRKTLAFDLAFSAPKSVSLMRMAAEPETAAAIDRAHERAVLSALSYVEREGWKGRERRGGGERVTVDGAGVMGVLYRHETTRNADPQLHSHAVLANVVRGPDGRPMAINSPVLYAQAKTAGTVYQAVLRGELGRELGVEFDRPVNGLADIKGFDRELVDQFSTRRAEILEQLRTAGFTPGGAAAERVALESRRAKDMDLDHVVWRGEVREVLEHAGLGREQAQAFTRSPAERDVASVDDRLAAAPVGEISSQKATEDARPVRQAAMSVPEGYTADEVDQALERVFHDERLVQVQEGDKPRWTTGKHLELEEQLRSDALARTQDTQGPRLPTDHAVPTQTPDGHALSSEQRGVLREILTSGRGVEVVRARAGAGKTTIAGLARREFEDQGYRVVGVAPTLQALAELDDVGLEKRDSLARTALGAGDYSPIMRTMDHRTVVILDEAAMAQTQQVAPLLRRAQERGAKVVAVGDDVQLQSVGAGGWFRYLAEHRDVPVLELTEVHRQRDEVERDRLNQLHRGDVAGWIRWADQADRITVASTVAEAYEETIERYRGALAEVGGDVDRLVVMAPANQHREQLNERLRRVAVDQGVVDRDREREFDGILVAPGDRLVARETLKPPAGPGRVVENGERFEVLSVGRDGIAARAVAGARRGQDVRLPAAVFGPDSKDGRIVEHGYARTIHKAQGMTVDRSILFVPEPGRIGQNDGYVGLSRTRDRADLITVADSRPQALEQLARSLGERRDHEAAIAYLDRPALEPERLRAMSAPELDEHRHALLTETRGAMTKLTRLDREARGAWAASGDARGDAALVTRRDQVEARIAERIAHLAEHDPDGDRQARPLMERTIRQGIDRDRTELERLDAQVIERSPIVTPADADARQHEIQTERGRTEQYVETLLQDLERVHGQQIDRTPRPGVDPMSVPEHERPGLAAREAREHRDRVAGLNLAAAQQLGVGHSLVARWVMDRGAEVMDRSVRRSRPGPLSVLQQRFHDALDRWWAVREPWEAAGGRGRMDTLRALVDRLQTARTEHDGALAEQRSHLASKAPRRPRSAVEVWRERSDALARNVEHATTARDRLEHQRVAVERDGNEPIDRLLNRQERGFETVRAARQAGREAEHDLRAAGPAGVGPEGIERLLGRRDDLSPTDQRRYDELAGRVATQQALSRMPADGRVAAWTGASRDDVQPDVARWRHEHDLTLSPTQQRVVDRDVAADRVQREDRDRRGGPGYER